MRFLGIGFGISTILAVTAVAWYVETRQPAGLPAEQQSAASAPNSAAPAQEPTPDPAALQEASGKLERALKLALEYQPFYERLKTLYPAEFERFGQTEALQLAKNPKMLALPDNILLDAVESLRKNRGINAAKASPGAIDKIFEMQANIMSALSIQDPRLCEHFLFGGDAPAFAEFSAQNRGLIARMAESGLSAIADGEANKIERDAPSAEDFALLEQRLTQEKLDKTEIAALLDGQMPEAPFDPARACSIGKSYYSALTLLPEGPRYAIYALALKNMAQ